MASRCSIGSVFKRLIVLSLAIYLSRGTARADRIDDLRATLINDPSWQVRLQAVAVLGQLHDRRSGPALVIALSDQNGSVRGLSAQLLGQLGDPQAISALERASHDPNALVRSRATAALAAIVSSSNKNIHVSVGGIGSRVAHAAPELSKKLREFVVRELAKTPGITLEGKPLSGFFIDSSITGLSRRATEQWFEVSCEVSLVVGRLPSKAMVMMTSGGATVQAPKAGLHQDLVQALQVDALAGAVKGAHENFLAFLKSQR